jgi:hypothetical protein
MISILPQPAVEHIIASGTLGPLALTGLTPKAGPGDFPFQKWQRNGR